MSLHIRPQGGNDALYNPQRDLAYCFPRMVEDVAARFNDERWPSLIKMVEREGASFEELCGGMDVFCKFLKSAQEQPLRGLKELLRESGWLDLKPAVQVGISAMLGVVTTGELFYAIRTLASIDAPHQPNLDPMLQHARWMKQIAFMPRWRQHFYFAFRGLLRKIRRLWSATLRMVGGD